MNHNPHHWKRILLIAGVVLVTFGVGVVIYFGVGVFSSYGEIRFAHTHHFDSHNPDTSSVRPWMSIRYVSSAYHIPEAYLFGQLGIPASQKNGLLSFRLLSETSGARSPRALVALLDDVRVAVDLYRKKFPPPGTAHLTGALLPLPPGHLPFP